MNNLAITLEYKRVLLGYINERFSRLSLDESLAVFGIDTAKPYTQIDMPEFKSHFYCQPPLPEGVKYDRTFPMVSRTRS